jgi:hypothetical protein
MVEVSAVGSPASETPVEHLFPLKHSSYFRSRSLPHGLSPLFPHSSPLLSGEALFGYRFAFVKFSFTIPLFLVEPLAYSLYFSPQTQTLFRTIKSCMFLYKHVRARHSSVV